MLYDLESVIGRKIGITVGFCGKKTSVLLPFLLSLPCCLGLLSWHNVHRQSGGHSAKIGWQRGGVDRGDVGACCKPNRGKVVRGITFCVCFAPLNPMISLFFANFRQGCESRTLATLKTTAQNLTGVYLTCQLSLACLFGSLCVCGSVFFFRWHFL